MAQGTVGVNILSNIVGIGGSNVSAFGDMIMVNPEPVVQIDFVYGLNTQTSTTAIVTTGVATTSSGRLSLSTGVGAAGAASLVSNRSAQYRAGEGMQARFTAVWDGATADCKQVVGVANTTSGYLFGYDGVTFGISIRNASTDTWTAQTAWNGDKCDGTGASGFIWDKTKGNVMQIQYPFLGYGNITFWVQNPATSSWILCHTIRYANSSASLQVSNPNFRFFANVVNTGSTTNRTMYVGSVLIAVTGQVHYLGGQWGADSLKNTITAETNLINIRNATTYNTLTNTGVIRLRSLSCATDNGNGIGTIRIKTGVTLGGVPVFTPINGATANNGVTITSGNSIASFDVAGTGTTGSTIFNVCLARNSNVTIDLEPYDLYVYPGQTITVTAFSAASASMQAALNWNEDV